MQSKLKDNGTTIIPTLLFINENGLAKIDVYLARGKKCTISAMLLKKKISVVQKKEMKNKQNYLLKI